MASASQRVDLATLVARGVMQRSGGALLVRVSRPGCPGDLAKGPGFNRGFTHPIQRRALQNS
jgi:hypothetical protein